MPENLIVFLDEANIKDIVPVEIENTSYEPILATVSSGGAVLSLYRDSQSEHCSMIVFQTPDVLFHSRANNLTANLRQTDEIIAGLLTRPSLCNRLVIAVIE